MRTRQYFKFFSQQKTAWRVPFALADSSNISFDQSELFHGWRRCSTSGYSCWIGFQFIRFLSELRSASLLICDQKRVKMFILLLLVSVLLWKNGSDQGQSNGHLMILRVERFQDFPQNLQKKRPLYTLRAWSSF